MVKKKCTIRDVEKHLNRFLNTQIGEKDTIDFFKFKCRSSRDKSKGVFVVNDKNESIKVPVDKKGYSRQFFVASLLNDSDKPYQHLNGELASKLVKGKRR